MLVVASSVTRPFLEPLAHLNALAPLVLCKNEKGWRRSEHWATGILEDVGINVPNEITAENKLLKRLGHAMKKKDYERFSLLYSGFWGLFNGNLSLGLLNCRRSLGLHIIHKLGSV